MTSLSLCIVRLVRLERAMTRRNRMDGEDRREAKPPITVVVDAAIRNYKHWRRPKSLLDNSRDPLAF